MFVFTTEYLGLTERYKFMLRVCKLKNETKINTITLNKNLYIYIAQEKRQ